MNTRLQYLYSVSLHQFFYYNMLFITTPVLKKEKYFLVWLNFFVIRTSKTERQLFLTSYYVAEFPVMSVRLFLNVTIDDDNTN